MSVRAGAAVNLAAIERNCARLLRETDSLLCAVVKADGYGHGGVQSARAALAGGAQWLAVATAAEAQALRAGGLSGPLLVLGALTREETLAVVELGADVVAWSGEFVSWLAQSTKTARVHVKLDSGMGRLGAREVEVLDGVVGAIDAAPTAELVGAMTHFATADELGDEFFGEQLRRFGQWVVQLRSTHPQLTVHAANSAALLRDRTAHFDMVRCGVAIYGLDPFNANAGARDLEPALVLRSWVAAIKPVRPGESAGYGRRHIATKRTNIATIPLGYGDGVRRALTNNGEVVIAGERFPIVGTVSMDNLTVDLGEETRIEVGAPATLIDETLSAEEMARRLNTINYEVTCGISARVPRSYHRDGVAELA